MQKPSKDPDELVRMIDANLAIRDDKMWAKLRHELSWKWYEFFILAGLFCFGIGVGATIIKALPKDNESLYWFMVLWLGGFLVMTVVAFEFLIRRYRTMRTAMLNTMRRSASLERQIKLLRKSIDKPLEDEEDEKEE